MYHYIECGLPNIYLKNGYTIEIIDNEEYFSIDDIHGLHEEIGCLLATKKQLLTGSEFKYFRIQFNQSRRVLGELLGVDQQTIARWEKNETAIPKMIDVAMRQLFLESINKDSNLNFLLEQLAEADALEQISKIILEETHNHWAIAI